MTQRKLEVGEQDSVNFTYLDTDDLYRELNIHDDVYLTAEVWQERRELLPTRAEEDNGEQIIRLRCEDAVASWEEQFRAPETRRVKLRNSITIDPHSPTSTLDQAISDIDQVEHDFKEEQKTLQSNLRREQDSLTRIKERYRLSREPVYAVKTTWAYIAALGVAGVETTIGTSFLAAISQNGLMGGASLSLIMSVVNIGTAALVGRFAPRLYSPSGNSRSKRVTGISFVIAAFAMVLNGNLMFGNIRHYGLEKLSTSLDQFWQGNVLPQSMESFGLAVLGILIFGAAFFTYSRLHDPVPDYERVHRRVVSLRESLANLIDQKLERLKAVVRNVNGHLDALTDWAQQSYINCRNSLAETKSENQSFVTGRERIINVHEQCAEKRRAALKYACQAVPQYWKETLVDFSTPSSGDEWVITTARTQVDRIEKFFSTFQDQIANARAGIEQSYRHISGIHQPAT